MLLRHTAQSPESLLQSLAQAFEALRVAQRYVFPVRVRQDEVVNHVRKGLPRNGHAHLFHVREIGLAQPSRQMLLYKEDFPARTFYCAPLLDAPLQRPQLRICKLSRLLTLQRFEERLGFESGVDFLSVPGSSPTRPQTDLSASAMSAPLSFRLAVVHPPGNAWPSLHPSRP